MASWLDASVVICPFSLRSSSHYFLVLFYSQKGLLENHQGFLARSFVLGLANEKHRQKTGEWAGKRSQYSPLPHPVHRAVFFSQHNTNWTSPRTRFQQVAQAVGLG